MKRITSDIFRVLSIIAVVAIHGTARSERLFIQEHIYTGLDFLGILVNQLSRFSVPLFIILSGYGLARSYEKYADQPLRSFPFRSFISSRFQKIILPYIFLSLLFLVGYGRFRGVDFSTGLGVLGNALLLGRAEYHLYFISFLLQLYLIFPLLLRLRSGWFLAFFLFFQALLLYPENLLYAQAGIRLSFPPSAIFVYWIYYFHLGIFTAHHRDDIKNILSSRHAMVFLAVIGTAGIVVGEYIFRSYTNPEPDYFNHFNRISVVAYSSAVFFLALLYDDAIENRWQREAKRIGILSALTFPVYLYHTMILRVLNWTPLSLFPIPLTVIVTIVSFGLAILMYLYLPKSKILRNITGIPSAGKDS